MCLLALAFDPRRGVFALSVREELLDRPALPPATWRAGDTPLFGPRDALQGGTWLAVNEAGRLAAVLNRPPAAGAIDPGRRTRGELPARVLARPSAAEARACVAAIDATRYNPFMLVVAEAAGGFARDAGGAGRGVRAPTRSPAPTGAGGAGSEPGAGSGAAARIAALAPGLHVFGSCGLVGPEACRPKVTRLRALAAASDCWAAPLAELAAAWQPVLADHTGADPRREQMCLHLPGYGTRSATLLRRPADGVWECRHLEGPPCQGVWVAAAVTFAR